MPKKSDDRTADIGLMRSASAEINLLRRHNEILAAKVEVVEVFQRLLAVAVPSRSQGMGEDYAWALDRRATELEQE